MEISNVSSNTQVSSTPPAQPASRDGNSQPPIQPPSSVVNISDKAKQLDEQRNSRQAAEERVTVQGQTESQSSKSPGIEFVTGASKGGKVNTFA